MTCTCTYNLLLTLGYPPKNIKHNEKCMEKKPSERIEEILNIDSIYQEIYTLEDIPYYGDDFGYASRGMKKVSEILCAIVEYLDEQAELTKKEDEKTTKENN